MRILVSALRHVRPSERTCHPNSPCFRIGVPQFRQTLHQRPSDRSTYARDLDRRCPISLQRMEPTKWVTTVDQSLSANGRSAAKRYKLASQRQCVTRRADDARQASRSREPSTPNPHRKLPMQKMGRGQRPRVNVPATSPADFAGLGLPGLATVPATSSSGLSLGTERLAPPSFILSAAKALASRP